MLRSSKREFKMFKKLMLVLGLVLFAASVTHAVEVGKAAPEFSLTDYTGKVFKLSDLKGKTVVLEWFNRGCPFVKKHYGAKNMQSLQKKYTGKGVVWLTIVSSAKGKEGYLNPEEVKPVVKELGIASTALLLDPKGTVGKAYQAKTTPHMYIVDKAGVLVYTGAIDDIPSTDPADIKGAKNYVSAALDELLAGKKVTVSTTKAYGCSVKY